MHEIMSISYIIFHMLGVAFFPINSHHQDDITCFRIGNFNKQTNLHLPQLAPNFHLTPKRQGRFGPLGNAKMCRDTRKARLESYVRPEWHLPWLYRIPCWELNTSPLQSPACFESMMFRTSQGGICDRSLDCFFVSEEGFFWWKKSDIS